MVGAAMVHAASLIIVVVLPLLLVLQLPQSLRSKLVRRRSFNGRSRCCRRTFCAAVIGGFAATVWWDARNVNP